jgi:FHS family L-fucose permease-like MFS transporter
MNGNTMPAEAKRMKNEASSQRVYAVIPFAMTISLFFFWGMAHNLNDILIAQFKRAFSLSNAQASLVQSAFYCAYLVMPLPVSIVMNKLGYRNAVLCGLVTYGVGAMLFWPAAAVHQYEAFLAVLFIVACGIVFLETSGMAMIAALGPSRSYEWRINLASAFNPVGSIAGIMIGRQFIFPSVELTPLQRALLSPEQAAHYSALQADAVRWPYLAIGVCVILWAIAIKMTPYPPKVDERRVNASFKGELAKLCKSPHYLYGVLVQLLYVGSQISCWSFLILYAKAQLPGITDRNSATYLIYSLCAFIAGRFTTTVCLRWFSLAKICAVAASASVALCIIAAAVGGERGVWSLVGVGFMMSVMFPAIFTMGLSGHEEEARLGTALMIMSIIGGAIITAIMGRVADIFSVMNAYFVPAACFAAVLIYALVSIRREDQRSSPLLHKAPIRADIVASREV